MKKQIFLDTDIILDLLLRREPFYEPAAKLIQAVEDGKVDGHVTPVLLSNLFYIVQKEHTRKDAFLALRRLVQILRVLPVDDTSVKRALASSFQDFEDALQYFAAVNRGIDVLVTRNKEDYSSSKLPILNAEECVEWLELD